MSAAILRQKVVRQRYLVPNDKDVLLPFQFHDNGFKADDHVSI